VLAGALDKASFAAVWHQAMTTPVADDALASQLDRAVTIAMAPTDRARVMEQAALLSADADSQALRWVNAAEARLAAGQAGLAIAATHRVAATSPASTRSRATLLEGRVATSSRTAREGFELMLKASEMSRTDALTALTAAAEVAWWAGRGDWAAEVARRVLGVTATDPAQVTGREAVLGGAAAFAGDVGSAGRHLRTALEAARSASTPDHHRMAGQAALLLGDDLAADVHLTRAVEMSRSSNDVSQGAFTLQMLASVKTWMGRIDHAEELLAEGRLIARRTGDERSHAFELTMSAHLQSLRGSTETSVTTAGAALQLVTGHDVGYLPASAVWAMGRADLARGRLASALAHLEEATSPSSSRADPVAALFAIPDLVEAASRHGRPDAARPGLARFEAWAEAGSPWARSVVPRLRALLATDDAEAESWYAAAEADPDRPFERARAQLLHGEHLRRSRHRIRARVLLEEARATFEALHAGPWTERAATELEATAETARRGAESALELTPQELRVARLVAEGASNGEVAEQLFVSRKTVESHLHKVYTKLAIGSRKQLAGALPPED
jgi:DNA-binding CsgD family transcriptional regulator